MNVSELKQFLDELPGNLDVVVLKPQPDFIAGAEVVKSDGSVDSPLGSLLQRGRKAVVLKLEGYHGEY